jgi:hypothetical protein
MDAVIDKILSTIDVANCGEQALARMSIVDRGPVEDSVTSVDTILSLEAGATVLDFLMAAINNRCCQASNNLTAVKVPE